MLLSIGRGYITRLVELAVARCRLQLPTKDERQLRRRAADVAHVPGEEVSGVGPTFCTRRGRWAEHQPTQQVWIVPDHGDDTPEVVALEAAAQVCRAREPQHPQLRRRDIAEVGGLALVRRETSEIIQYDVSFGAHQLHDGGGSSF